MAKCALHLTIFLNVTSFYRVTGTAELTKANFLLRTERLFQTQTYSGQTPRQMHVICLEESYGLSEPVNIWLVQNEGRRRDQSKDLKLHVLYFDVEGNVLNFGRPVFILKARVIYKRWLFYFKIGKMEPCLV